MFYFSHLTAMAATAVLSHLLTDAIPSACFIIVTCVLGVVTSPTPPAVPHPAVPYSPLPLRTLTRSNVS